MFKKFEIDELIGNGSFESFGNQAITTMLEGTSTNTMTPDAFGELSEAIGDLAMAIATLSHAFQLDALNFEQLLISHAQNTDVLRDLNAQRIITFVEDPNEKKKQEQQPINDILSFAGVI